jgi:hypothetical protein
MLDQLTVKHQVADEPVIELPHSKQDLLTADPKQPGDSKEKVDGLSVRASTPMKVAALRVETTSSDAAADANARVASTVNETSRDTPMPSGPQSRDAEGAEPTGNVKDVAQCGAKDNPVFGDQGPNAISRAVAELELLMVNLQTKFGCGHSRSSSVRSDVDAASTPITTEVCGQSAAVQDLVGQLCTLLPQLLARTRSVTTDLPAHETQHRGPSPVWHGPQAQEWHGYGHGGAFHASHEATKHSQLSAPQGFAGGAVSSCQPAGPPGFQFPSHVSQSPDPFDGNGWLPSTVPRTDNYMPPGVFHGFSYNKSAAFTPENDRQWYGPSGIAWRSAGQNDSGQVTMCHNNWEYRQNMALPIKVLFYAKTFYSSVAR